LDLIENRKYETRAIAGMEENVQKSDFLRLFQEKAVSDASKPF